MRTGRFRQLSDLSVDYRDVAVGVFPVSHKLSVEETAPASKTFIHVGFTLHIQNSSEITVRHLLKCVLDHALAILIDGTFGEIRICCGIGELFADVGATHRTINESDLSAWVQAAHFLTEADTETVAGVRFFAGGFLGLLPLSVFEHQDVFVGGVCGCAVADSNGVALAHDGVYSHIAVGCDGAAVLAGGE